ncbi:hypothetical protein BDV97DRAFT_91222 [Delphinella strobiligena]|nr:hypothetical protein BDV97DRAFT_91222 [Delphinella strobiligena]
MLVWGLVIISGHHRNKEHVPRPCRKKICKKLGVDELRVCVNDAGQRNGRLRLIAFNQTPMRRCQAVSVFETAQGPIRVSIFEAPVPLQSQDQLDQLRVQQWLGFGGVKMGKTPLEGAVCSYFFTFASSFCPPANPAASTVRPPWPKLEQLQLTNLLVCGSARNLSHSTVRCTLISVPHPDPVPVRP